HGGRWRTCWRWPQPRSATQSPTSSWWNPTISRFMAPSVGGGQRAADQVPRDARGRGGGVEPAADVGVEPHAVHEVVEGLAQARPEALVVAARGVDERQLVAGEQGGGRGHGLGREADAVDGGAL